MQPFNRNAAIRLFFIGLSIVEAHGQDLFQAFGRVQNGGVSETNHASASATAFAPTANTAPSAFDANIGLSADVNSTAEERLADDLNGNSSDGFRRVVSLVDGEQVVIGTIIDFGDLHEFNVFFDTVAVSEAQAFTSLEVMKQHVFYASPGENRLATGWRFDAYKDDWSAGFGEEVRGGWAIDPERLDSINHDWLRDSLAATSWSTYGTLGVRAMRLEDDFSFDGRGSILGRTQVATMIDHDVIGPQLGWGVVAEASMFRFEAVLLGLVGYGNAETKQAGIFGEELIPGALNRPSTGRTTHSHDETNDDYFAWHGEARITGSCYLTQHLRFDATWRGILSGPVRDATTVTAWNAPDFGINNLSGETIDASHWFFGLTYTH